MDKISELKNQIRKRNSAKRKLLNIPVLSDLIIQNLFKLEEFKKAKNVFCYVSFGNEINTNIILNLKDKNIFVPKIIGEEMIMTKYTPDELQKNKFGIPEPVNHKSVIPKANDIIIVPALACGLNFYRIGYGKGFYDKFLAQNTCIKIALIPSELTETEIPHDKFDIPVDIIVTENKIYSNNLNL